MFTRELRIAPLTIKDPETAAAVTNPTIKSLRNSGTDGIFRLTTNAGQEFNKPELANGTAHRAKAGKQDTAVIDAKIKTLRRDLATTAGQKKGEYCENPGRAVAIFNACTHARRSHYRQRTSS